MSTDELTALIRTAFSHTDHPGDGFLLGSREGEDAFEAVEPFRGHTDWSTVDHTVLDENYDALSFLSEGGFRFFLPAFLVADINGRLETADPVFHLERPDPSGFDRPHRSRSRLPQAGRRGARLDQTVLPGNDSGDRNRGCARWRRRGPGR